MRPLVAFDLWDWIVRHREAFEPPVGNKVIREGGLMLVPALTPHAPHRPADTWGLVIEIKRAPGHTESLVWFCERCDARIHEVTMQVGYIEKDLKAAIERFDASVERRTGGRCGHVQPETPPV